MSIQLQPAAPPPAPFSLPERNKTSVILLRSLHELIKIMVLCRSGRPGGRCLDTKTTSLPLSKYHALTPAVKQLVGESVNHRGRKVVVLERAPDALQVAVLLPEPHGIYLPEAVR